MKQSQVDSQPKRNKDGSIRKKPGRKPKTEVLHTMSFPSLTLRQTAIILATIRRSMGPGFMVDGEEVTAYEWVDVAAALARGFK